MSQAIYYVNGEFVSSERAVLPVGDLGLVRGYGVFDFLRTYGRVPFRLRDHVLRLRRSAHAIGIDLPWTVEEIEAIAMDTYDRNDFADAGIRIIVTGGPSPDGMTPQQRPSLIVMVAPVRLQSQADFDRGYRATTAVVVRERPAVKSINYTGAIMAVEAAKRTGAIEALYRTPDGRVTEGTRANFFVVKGSQLITPGEEILEGVTRRVVIELAAGHFDVAERPIRYAELASVDEAFLTSTTKEIMPLVQIDDMTIGNGTPGPVTRQLWEMFHAYTAMIVAEAVA